ncbi:MAG TPA: hypothetical protein VFG46_05975 [Chryseolinea sp.]|nr:hypothetical protein [Chryseolinea sp.]
MFSIDKDTIADEFSRQGDPEFSNNTYLRDLSVTGFRDAEVSNQVVFYILLATDFGERAQAAGVRSFEAS